jgi:hypothetical protein
MPHRNFAGLSSKHLMVSPHFVRFVCRIVLTCFVPTPANHLKLEGLNHHRNLVDLVHLDLLDVSHLGHFPFPADSFPLMKPLGLTLLRTRHGRVSLQWKSASISVLVLVFCGCLGAPLLLALVYGSFYFGIPKSICEQAEFE